MEDETMADEDKNDDANIFIEHFKLKGVSVGSVKDGIMMLFTRTWIQALLDAHPTQEVFELFVKRQTDKDRS
jgi:hypothetical protein